MVKHTQTICRQQPTNCLNVSDYFVELTLKGLKTKQKIGLSLFIVENCVFQQRSSVLELTTKQYSVIGPFILDQVNVTDESF